MKFFFPFFFSLSVPQKGRMRVNQEGEGDVASQLVSMASVTLG